MSKKKNDQGGEGDISFDESSGQVPQTQGETPAAPPAGSGATGYYQSATTPTGPVGGGGPGAGYYQSATTPTGSGAAGYYGAAGVSQTSNTVAEGAKSGKSGKISGKVSQSSSTVAEGLSATDKAANIQALVGRTIDRYRIIKLLGEGGFGAVYMAEHTLMKRNCAFKTLHKELGKDPAVLHRFKKEGQVSSRFKHKNCIELYDFGQMDDGTYFMAMEFLPGKDLRDILKKRGALELGETFDIMIQTLSGLQAAHEGGVIHRDLKPDNIKLEEREGRTDFIKILDFGIAKIADADSKLDEQTGKISSEDAENLVDEMGEVEEKEVPQSYKTQVGAFFGTPEYGSPEQCAGEEIDSRSDLYTMGVILYECLTGSLPFVSKTPQGYLAQHMVAPPRPISEIRPDLKIPTEVESLIMKALEKRREDRFQNGTEFAQAMIDVAHEIGIPITVEGGGTIVVKTPMWKLVTFVGLPVTLLSMGLAWALVNRDEDPVRKELFETAGRFSQAKQLDKLLVYLESGGGKKENLVTYKDFFDERIPKAQADISTRNIRFEKFMADVKATYDDVKVEDRVYDPIFQKIETFQNDEPEVMAKSEFAEQLRDKKAQIMEGRDRDAATFWKSFEPQINNAVDELDQELANSLLRSFPKKFEATPTKQVVEDKRKSVADTFDQMNPEEKKARPAMKLVDDYVQASPTDFKGQLARYQEVVAKYPGTRVATNGVNTKIPNVKKAWEEAAQAALRPLRDKLEAAKTEKKAEGFVATMNAWKVFPDNVRGAEQGDKDLEALRLAIAAATRARWTIVDGEAKKLREGYQPSAALAAVTPWRSVEFFEKTVSDKAALFDESLQRVIPMHQLKLAMVHVPTADVQIGEDLPSAPSGPIQPAQSIEGFYVDLTETTNQMWFLFISDPWLAAESADWPKERKDLITTLPTGWSASDAAPTGTFPQGQEAHPVRGVSYDQVLEFCRWAGKRLPTEFEWEYAARGPSIFDVRSGRQLAMKYPWGDQPAAIDWTTFCNYYQDPTLVASGKKIPTFPVTNFENGKSLHFGIYEMSGNVAEWTSSPYLKYDGSTCTDADFSNTRRVVRGGSFLNESLVIRPCRVAARTSRLPTERLEDVGFRCVKSEKLIASK